MQNDLMNKIILREKLLANQQRNIDELILKIHSFDAGDDLNKVEEKSNFKPGKIHPIHLLNAYKEQLDRAELEMQNLLSMDFSKKNIAVPGAVVSTEIFHFLLGHVMYPFDFEEKRIVGISEESSFYSNIFGKKIGENFSFSFNNYQILEIN